MSRPSPAGRTLGSAWRPSTRQKRASATISRGDVVRTAIGVLDAEGLGAVTMRRVARDLGVGVTTLYWHVSDKDELLELVCDAVLEGVASAGDGGPWRSRIRDSLVALRRTLLGHGDLALHFAAQPNVGPHALALREKLAEALEEAGCDATRARSLDRVLLSFTTGACCAELAADAAAARQGLSPEDVEGQIGRFLADLPAETYPALVRLGRESQFTPREADFVLGVDCILDGMV